ncbi:MAG: hypothetical protein IAE82_09375 [Opitutaceae bacterium]|nr:hypothetical protein [Opitutaceae bacterium]
MSTASPTSLLADLPDSVLWSSRPWTHFATLPKARRPLVVLPIFGFADWGLGRSLDLEETLGCGVLRAMFASDPDRAASTLVLPPLRFVLGPYPHTFFGIDFETALDLVREIAASVLASGSSRLVLFNTSPWNEELAKLCACDLRVDLGLRTYVVHLAALGLDLHPTRSSVRAAVQAAACALTRRAPSDDVPRGDSRLIDFRPGDHRQPPPLTWTKSLDAAVTEGWTTLANAGARLARLLAEIDGLPGLAPREPATRARTSTGPSAKRTRRTKESRTTRRPSS